MSAAPGVYRRAWRRPAPPRQRRFIGAAPAITQLATLPLGWDLFGSLSMVAVNAPGSASTPAGPLLLTDPNFVPQLVFPHFN